MFYFHADKETAVLPFDKNSIADIDSVGYCGHIST
jgi:hypothetical protein